MELKERLNLERPLVFFDIESTGLDTYEDRIVELAMVKVSPDRDSETFCMRFNPMKKISKEATDVHGITDDDVRGEPPFRDYAKQVADFFVGCDVGGYNIRTFDLPMLMNELGRFELGLKFPFHIVDCCDIFHQMEPRDLVAASQFYCGRIFDAHRAMADVEATIAVLVGQILRYGDMPTTPKGIHGKFMDPDAVDIAGKLRKEGESIVLTFGKHRGTALDSLPQSYLQWMLKANVIGPDAVHLVKGAIASVYKRGRGFVIPSTDHKGRNL